MGRRLWRGEGLNIPSKGSGTAVWRGSRGVGLVGSAGMGGAAVWGGGV